MARYRIDSKVLPKLEIEAPEVIEVGIVVTPEAVTKDPALLDNGVDGHFPV